MLPSYCQANKFSVSKRNSRVSSGTDPVKVSYTVRSVQVNNQALLHEAVGVQELVIIFPDAAQLDSIRRFAREFIG